MFKIITKPSFVTLDPTTVCNLRCVHCHNSMGLSPTTHVMGMKQVEEVVELSRTQPGLRVSITGSGEVLCHPQWKEIIKKLEGNNINAEFYTNALLLTDEDIDFCWSSPAFKVMHISVDAANAETYKNIRGEDFNKLTTILKKICSYTPRGVVRISMVLMKENVNQIKDFIDYAAEVGADAVSYQDMFDRSYIPIVKESGFVFDDNQKSLPPELDRQILEAAKHAKTKRIFVDTERMPHLRKYRLMVEHKSAMNYWMKEKRIPLSPLPEAEKELRSIFRAEPACVAPWLEFSHSPVGWRICCMQYPNTSFGGKDATLEEAWNSPEAQLVRKRLLNNELPKECDPRHCPIARKL